MSITNSNLQEGRSNKILWFIMAVLVFAAGVSSTRAVDETLPSENSLPAEMERLPGESELPDGISSTNVQNAPDANLVHVRLDMRGPVGNLRSVAFSRDGARICAAGEDKTVHVWGLRVDAERTRWAYERSIRWQVERGARGHIYSLDCGAEVVAFAGLGAMSQSGEILLANPRTGEHIAGLHSESAHRDTTITGVCLSPNSSRLASVDVDGRVCVWDRNEQNEWSHRVVIPDYTEAYGGSGAARTAKENGIVPFASFVGNNDVLVTRLTNPSANPHDFQWAVHLHSLKDMVGKPLSGQPIPYAVTCISSARFAPVAAAAGLDGIVRFWRLGRPQPPTSYSFQQKGDSKTTVISSIAIQDNGTHAVVATDRGENPRVHQLHWFVLGDDVKKLRTWDVATRISSCDISSDGNWVAYAQANELHIRETQGDQHFVQRSSMEPIADVRLSETPPYVLTAKTRSALAAPSSVADLRSEWSFDTSKLEIVSPHVRPPAAADAYANVSVTNALEVDGIRVTDGPVDAYYVVPRHEGHRHGNAARAQYVAVAIPSDGDRNIFLYRMDHAGKQVRLERMYRGHEGTIRTISASGDGRFLVSGGDDGIVRFWRLPTGEPTTPLQNFWGLTCEPVGNRLWVSQVDPDSPAYYRSVRSGDRIGQVGWNDAGDRSTADPAEILKHLRSPKFDSATVFQMGRGGVATAEQWNPALSYKSGEFAWFEGELFEVVATEVEPGNPPNAAQEKWRKAEVTAEFHLRHAWPPVASFFMAANREWAYWTPSGHYSASFQGHRLFGWLHNVKGIDRLPTYVPAWEHHRTLERHRIMSRLLASKSLEDAIAQAGEMVPGHPELQAAQLVSQRPLVEIISPDAHSECANRFYVDVAVTVSGEQQIDGAQCYVNGVPSITPYYQAVVDEVTSDTDNDSEKRRFRWEMHAPSDRELLIQVIVKTAAGATVVREQLVRQAKHTADAKRSLYLLAVGTSDYLHIPKLQFASKSVMGVRKSMQYPAVSRFARHVGKQLVDHDLTRASFRSEVEELSTQSIHPDDLIVVYFYGHGTRDRVNDSYNYVTSKARLSDVIFNNSQDCINFRELAPLRDLPCRKLVILDTCYSGVDHPERAQDLNYAIRALEDGMFLTLTASEGQGYAYEDRKQQMGFFTAALVRGLRGSADANKDQVVAIQELVDYVREEVTASSKQSQYPTAGPPVLLELIDQPLTHVAG